MYARGFAHITAQALVPEQIVSYVTAVGQSVPTLCKDCVAYDFEEQRTLIAYPSGTLPGEEPARLVTGMDDAVAAALESGACTSLTVLGTARPILAPEHAVCEQDAYAILPLPLMPPAQNLRNMLRRGERECQVAEEQWGDEHASLVREYLISRRLEEGTRHIYGRIPDYLAATPGAVLFAARDATARLLGFAIGDFSSLMTAFYMFAFRQHDCPPGVADVLLHTIVDRAETNGHQYINLGLGINEGISAFKRKWGKALFLPCVQTSWDLAPAKRRIHPVPGDPLAVFTPPTFAANVRRFLLGENSRPFDCLQIEVTSQCPGQCFYCPHTTKRELWRSRRMQDATYAALLPLIRATKRVHLQGWGEPLLHPRFFDYATAAARTGCAVSTTTYGLAVTPANAERLVSCGIDIVAFSLTGIDEAGNAARAGVPFARVIEGILALNRAKQKAHSDVPHVHLAYLMLAGQIDATAGLPALMERYDVPVAVVSTLDYIAAPGMERQAFAPGETEKIERARSVLSAAASNAADAGRTIVYSLPGETGRTDCNEQIQTCMYIDADGLIAPCIYCNLPTTEDDPNRRVFGSVHEKKPMDIWADSDYAHFRTRLAQGDPDWPCVTCAKRFERLF